MVEAQETISDPGDDSRSMVVAAMIAGTISTAGTILMLKTGISELHAHRFVAGSLEVAGGLISGSGVVVSGMVLLAPAYEEFDDVVNHKQNG